MQYGLPLAEAVPLFAALLSLPLPADYAPLTVSPEQQKQQTLHALLTILLRIAAQQPVLFVMEDLHWVDPSTLELLSLLVDQGPTARILALFTFRPDFSPPWTGRSHLTQVTLHRLPRRQAAEMTGRVAHGKALPAEVVEQVVAKTDGVPLFVEELTKMVLESGLLQEREERYELTGPLPPLAIPTTLHDSLMARLDRLATVKGLAQLGATLGREFSYALLQAVSPWDEATLQRGLHQLVEAEFLYQRGLPPQATYLFKHALIQDAAYQSLLRSTRQQYHQRIAQVLEAHFPEIAETQPELLAHHYTEAGLATQAIPYWQRAGQRAIERSAHVEAISHLTKGLEVLKTPPRHPRARPAGTGLADHPRPGLDGHQGPWGPGSGARLRPGAGVCQQVGETPQLFPVLWGLWRFYHVRAELQTARELGEQLLGLAQRAKTRRSSWRPTMPWGHVVLLAGRVGPGPSPSGAGVGPLRPQQHRALAFRYGHDPGVVCHSYAAWTLWMLGYPDQALPEPRGTDPGPGTVAPLSLASALLCGLAPSVPPGGAGSPGAAEAAMAARDRAGISAWLAHGDDPAGLGAGRAGTGGRRGWRRYARVWPPIGPRGQSCDGRIILPAGRGVWESGAGRGGLARAGRGPGTGGEHRGALVGGGAVSAQRGVAAAAHLGRRIARRRRKPVSSRPSTLPAASRPSRWSCGRR